MAAQIVYLDEFRANRNASHAAVTLSSEVCEREPQFHFWAGVSGRRYVHTVYELLTCPEVPPANYLLVRRDRFGRRKVLAVGGLEHDAASLNLAELRQRGACLGANEVHIHYLAKTEHQRRLVELDLRAGHKAEVVDELRCGTCH